MGTFLWRLKYIHQIYGSSTFKNIFCNSDIMVLAFQKQYFCINGGSLLIVYIVIHMVIICGNV